MAINCDSMELAEDQSTAMTRSWLNWLFDFIFVLILIAGAYFRFTGSDWALDYHLHPDERFLVWVTTDITPVQNLGEYFDTDISSLNPHNRGHGFFVYGTFPIFIVRYLADWLNQSGWGDVNMLGRTVSALFDLGTVAIIYAIGLKVFKKKAPALASAAFYSFSVLPIQLSHYYTVDTAANFFGFLAVLMAIIIQDLEQERELKSETPPDFIRIILGDWKSAIPYMLFGIFLGMATASKINAVVLSILIIIPNARYFLSQISLLLHRRKAYLSFSLRNIFIAAILSFLIFRILQPYAFSGPGFFNMNLNDRWIQNLTELANLSSGNNWGFPPAAQWVDRPITFAFQNMVLWGLGLPLGVLAWVGFVWLSWRIIKGKETNLNLIWIWTLGYFLWQSVSHTSSMRYQMLVYPTLAIIAGWTLWALWVKGSILVSRYQFKSSWIFKTLSVVTTISVLFGSFGWAFAFTRIYNRPITRIEASEWIYQNIPGPINLSIQNEDVQYNQPLSFPLGFSFTSSTPITLVYSPNVTGLLESLNLSFLRETNASPGFTTLVVTILDNNQQPPVTVQGSLPGEFAESNDPRGSAQSITFDQPIQVTAGMQYTFLFQLLEEGFSLSAYGPLTVEIQTDNRFVIDALPDPVHLLAPGETYSAMFSAQVDGYLTEVFVNRIVDWQSIDSEKIIEVRIIQPSGDGSDPLEIGSILGTVQISSSLLADNDPRGNGLHFLFEDPPELVEGQSYMLELQFLEGEGALAIYGTRQAVESSWDDPLPYAMNGYNPFDYFNGLYRTDLNFEIYWEDNLEKLDRISSILDRADYIFISSSRQWGSLSRLPEQYPLTSDFYRALIGCPEDREITWCYSVATPGMFEGLLGYELVEVVQSYPNLGTIQFNTQFAEEAFTVYDHPKVLIFQRTSEYQSDQVYELLSQALTGGTSTNLESDQAVSTETEDLMLPPDVAVIQSNGGTWSELFNTEALINRYPGLGAILWYLLIGALGWMVYPMVRIAFSGLPDRGFPFSKLIGLLLWALISWQLGSNDIAFSRQNIMYGLSALFFVNIVLALFQRKEISHEIKERWQYFLKIELFGLVIFLIFLLIRFGNSDLWHPAKGGEKPMDFSYFNAVLRSTVFPPYDPWFAGGTLNYYYYGFVIAAVPVKFLGIVPSIAYNFILPTFFSLFGLGAFSLGSNIYSATRNQINEYFKVAKNNVFWISGITTVLGALVLGNLGTIRMIWHGMQRLGSNGVDIATGGLIQGVGWALQGLVQIFGGAGLPYGFGDWYWNPSRVIPGEPITEFPMFTFLYADPHAHLLALPITLIALGWSLSIILIKWRWIIKKEKPIQVWINRFITIFIGAVALGALKSTNTWDFPTYLVIACIAIMFSSHSNQENHTPNPVLSLKTIAWSIGSVLVLVGLSYLLYLPFSNSFHAGYSAFDIWQGDHTPLDSYFTHWGLFLFIIISWEIWEIVDWMKNTPASSLLKLKPYKIEIYAAGITIIIGLILLLTNGIVISFLVIPMALLAGILLFRIHQNNTKRFILLLIGTGLVLTLVVEIIALRGDIGRMNTVFKFYLQAWTLLSISSAAALTWLVEDALRLWKPTMRSIWQVFLAVLVGSAALFPILATVDKIRDRMATLAPHSLDGMLYMNYAHYSDSGVDMDLSQDYRAIRWMQENIVGSPVIVEANTPEYRWGSRFTIYTGLPGVVGWNWHQRQQRSVANSDIVVARVEDVGEFYATEDRAVAVNFIETYDVQYIIVGQLERAYYTGSGILKFEEWNGELWHEVYRDGVTVIYEILP